MISRVEPLTHFLQFALWIVASLVAGLAAAQAPANGIAGSRGEIVGIEGFGSLPLDEQNPLPKRRRIFRASKDEPEKIDLKDLPVKSEQLVGKDIIVEGKVKSINYAPEIHNGKTLHSLVISDDGVVLRVVFASAVLYAEGDFLRLRGVLRENPISGALEVTDVDVEPIEYSKESYARWAKPYSNDAAKGVPTEVIPTPLSTAGEISAVLAAIFGLVVVIGQVLDRRKALILLPLEESKSEVVEGKIVIRIRVFPSGNTPLVLSSNISLKKKRFLFSKSWGIEQVCDPDSGPVRFPLILQGEKDLELIFQYSAEDDSTMLGNWLLFWSCHGSRRILKNRLPWLQAILVAPPGK